MLDAWLLLLLLLRADPCALPALLPLPAAACAPLSTANTATSTMMARQGTSSGHSSSASTPGSECSVSA
jgi:hypothetical protein